MRLDLPALAGSGADEVGQDGAVQGLDDRPVRDGEDQVLPRGAVAVGALPGAARDGAPVRGVVVVEQGRRLGIDLEDDVPAVPAVAAVRTT
jgi:hypothetical protein